MSEIQRSRLLAGAIGAIDERGYAATTVSHIAARARISRRTFYELFADREACLAALLDHVQEEIERELAQARVEQGLPWRDRVRGGLHVILSFLDREPALARVCLVHALRAGPQALARREAVSARLARVLDEGRAGPGRGNCSALTAEGLVGAAFTIVHARLARREQRPLVELLGELMAMIVLPYQGPAVARREQQRPTPRSTPAPLSQPVGERDPLQRVPMRVTYRTARVLHGIASNPGVSNRVIADHAGVHDQGQISKLLARLERLGLAVNHGEGHTKGEPNAWTLTALGEQVAWRVGLTHEVQRRTA